ncbi:MAG: YdcF family protein [Traorella sp.]
MKYEKGKEYLYVLMISISLSIIFYLPSLEKITLPVRHIILITLPPYIFFSFYKTKAKIKSQIVILGCGLLDSNRISPLLMQRCQIAIELYQKEPKQIVVSGGMGKDESISEAKAMKEYIIKQGINEKDILLEEKSSNTKENLLYTSILIGNSFTIVTSDYHRPRVYLLTKIIGLNTTILTSHSIFYYRIYAMMREYLAILSLFTFPLVILYFILFFLL